MKFLADECCNISIVDKLRAAGHNVLYIVEEEPGITDTEVLAKAFAKKRILITEDKDFGELVYRLKKEAVGIILLRFSSKEHKLKWHRLEELLQRDDITLINNMVVVDTEKFRIRPLL